MSVSAGPHDFAPLRWVDRLLRGGRCRHCYLGRDAHPVSGWTPARPLGDRSWPGQPRQIAGQP